MASPHSWTPCTARRCRRRADGVENRGSRIAKNRDPHFFCSSSVAHRFSLLDRRRLHWHGSCDRQMAWRSFIACVKMSEITMDERKLPLEPAINGHDEPSSPTASDAPLPPTPEQVFREHLPRVYR